VRTLPQFKEIAQFFTSELATQLADSRSTTTAKLDAPVNKLARLLNSPSIKRVLLNESLRVDFDRVIAGAEVLVVKGALGAMGAGNTSVLMQLLVGMLDAALARQQDLVPAEDRIAVALKIDEAPLVLNRGFADTMALKRSAGLETVACWQADSQWIDRDVRDQLDALFAHRVYFATASARDARSAVELTMAEFSDTVRPGLDRLSALGHPDVRLRLPKHHAIASWLTPDGRQSAFVAQTLPMSVDRERLAAHARSQRERGARHLADLRQPHWERSADSPPASRLHADLARTAASPLPQRAAASYRELVELDGAHSARVAARNTVRSDFECEPLDLEILALLAALRNVLSSQVHRRFNEGRAQSTTQRRLKRLADAGLVERFQFHRRDGGGVPMGYLISDAGLAALTRADHGTVASRSDAAVRGSRPSMSASGEAGLREARSNIHIAGWVLAVAAFLGAPTPTVRGRDAAAIPVPADGADGRRVLLPRSLRLPGGRTPHDFIRLDASGRPEELERFDSLRPDAVIEIDATLSASGRGIDLIVERDERLFRGRAAAKLERYDHFLAGWCVHTRRYGTRGDAVPLVVFICRDRGHARACARSADAVLRAARAYAGDYPSDWEYPGREGILFAAERDAHEGLLDAYGVPRLPPEVRVAAAHGDGRAGEARPEHRLIVPARGAHDR